MVIPVPVNGLAKFEQVNTRKVNNLFTGEI